MTSPYAAASMRLGPGTTLDERYRLTSVLGDGGTGSVYEAVAVETGQRVAVKIIHREHAGDAQIRGRFRREVAILERLRGPHLCPVLDSGETRAPAAHAGLMYIVLPKLEGRSLEKVLEAEGLPPIERAVAWMLDVCTALQSAHGAGVVHRDLKPANVMLAPSGEVHVVDFGLAKIVTGGGPGTTGLTAHNMLVGTPEYMAPEQARGEEPDARCDVYAVGIMLYELLTGNVPFTGPSPIATLSAHLTAAPAPPRERAPERAIPEALEAVILHALAKEADDRYPTAEALAGALRSAMATPTDRRSVRPQLTSRDPEASQEALAITHPDLGRIAKAPPLPSMGLVTPTDPMVPVSERSPSARRRMVALWVVAAAVSIALGAWLASR